MWARMVVAPWWARWLVNALVTAVALGVIATFGLPSVVATIGWLWALVAVVGFSLVFTGAAVFIQNPVAQTYAAALAGLNLRQRTEAVKALRRGVVPSDARVLAAAIRVGTLNLAYLGRAMRWQRTAKWWVPALYVVLAILDFTANDTKRGLLWAGFALYFAAYFGWTSYRARQLPQRVGLLRAAATDSPEATAAAADTEDSIALPPRRIRAVVLLFVVVVIGFGTMGFLLSRQTPDCRTADAAADFIYTHRDMLDARLITAGDPDLSRYQDWSDQLQNYARQVSTPDISRRLHRIAALSVQAVSLVRDMPSEHQTEYQNTVEELASEERDLVSACHPHG